MSSNPLEMPKLPIGNDPGMPGVSVGGPPAGGASNPNQMAQLLQALLMRQQGGGQPQQMPGQVSPAMVGQAPQARPAPQPVQMAGGAGAPMPMGPHAAPAPQSGGGQPQGGGGGPQIPPAMLPGATQGGPASMHTPYNPTPAQSATSYGSRNAATQATVQNALANLSTAMQQGKQEQFQKQVQQTKATMMQYLMLKQSENPEMQAQADQMIKDPKIAKQLEKAQKDANSPQYYGIQAAYQDAMAAARNKDEMAKIQAETLEHASKAKEADEKAALYKKKTEQEGTVTEKDKFESDQKGARIRTQAAAVNQRTQEMAEAAKTQAKAHLDGIQKQTNASIQVANIRAEAIKAVHTGDNKVQDSLTKDYNSIANHAAKLQKEAADLQKHLDAHFWNPYTDAGKETMHRIQRITQRHDQLTKQLQKIEEKRGALQKYDVIPQDAPEPASAAAGGSESQSQQGGDIVFTQEDINSAGKSSSKSDDDE